MGKSITKIVKDNGANVAKIVLGGVVMAAGLLSAIKGKDDDGEKYEPGEISEALSEDNDESTEDSESSDEEEA